MSPTLPTITAKALGSMPQFVLGELGERGLHKTFSAAGLPEYFIEHREGYIPEQALANFVAETARALGHDYLGLLWTPFITVADFGKWGSYILSAPTLGTALLRAIEVTPMFTSRDWQKLTIDGPAARFTYHFGLPDHKAYPDIAYTSLASILSIPKHFLGCDWTPRRIEFNIPRPAKAYLVEEAFGCPVEFASEELAFIFPSKDLRAPNRSVNIIPKTTIQEIAREMTSGPPANLTNTVRGIIMAQYTAQELDVDTVARQLDTGVRSLQLALAREGTTFRQIANRTTAERAIELLGLPGETVSSVSSELGYTSPTNFSRAFKKETGLPPRAFLHRQHIVYP